MKISKTRLIALGLNPIDLLLDCQAQPIFSSSWLRLALFQAFPHPATHPPVKSCPAKIAVQKPLNSCCSSALSLGFTTQLFTTQCSQLSVHNLVFTTQCSQLSVHNSVFITHVHNSSQLLFKAFVHDFSPQILLLICLPAFIHNSYLVYGYN